MRWTGLITCLTVVMSTTFSYAADANVSDQWSFKRSLNNSSYGYTLVDDVTGSAPSLKVERFEVRSGDCASQPGWSDCASDRERSELSENGSAPPGSEYWYGWSFYLPSSHPNIYPTKVALGQFHQRNSSVPAFMFQNDSGGLLIDKSFGHSTEHIQLISQDELLGRWHHIEVHAKWDTLDGFFRVYVNGDLKYEATGSTMSGSGIYFKYGLYRSFLSRYKTRFSTQDVPTQVVFFANVRRSATRQGIQ
jgi:hypothetical protein